MKHTIESLQGRRFNKLLVIEEADNIITPNGRNHRAVLCQCDCGNKRAVLLVKLLDGRCLSCGCIRKKRLDRPVKRVAKIRNYSPKDNPLEYSTWVGMKNRCGYPKDKSYKYYGGRGITVCKEWVDSFDNFLLDMGKRPSPKHSLDRIDNEKGYCKENCRWANHYEQGRNKRNNVMIDFNGTVMCLSEWSRQLGISAATIINRLKSGWSTEKALTYPLQNKKRRNKAHRLFNN